MVKTEEERIQDSSEVTEHLQTWNKIPYMDEYEDNVRTSMGKRKQLLKLVKKESPLVLKMYKQIRSYGTLDTDRRNYLDVFFPEATLKQKIDALLLTKEHITNSHCFFMFK